jgi:hypothetical protein
MLTEALIAFTDCTSMMDLAMTVKSWAYKIFGVSATRIILVENDEFVVYLSQQEYSFSPFIYEYRCKRHSVSTGISGVAYKTKKKIVMSDVQSNKDYNPLVDLSSILPVMYAPVIWHYGYLL